MHALLFQTLFLNTETEKMCVLIYQCRFIISTWMEDRISMSISADSPSDETLKQVPWRCSCGDSMNFPLELI